MSSNVFAEVVDVSEKNPSTDQVKASVESIETKNTITDLKIRSDLKGIESLRNRLEALLQNHPQANERYGFARAQALLTFAQNEYQENDRSDVSQRAFLKAKDLIQKLEAESSAVVPVTQIMDAQELLGSQERIREDLWSFAEQTKKDRRFPCAEVSIARLEVALNWASNEREQKGFAGAIQEISLAEEYAERAKEELASCNQQGRCIVKQESQKKQKTIAVAELIKESQPGCMQKLQALVQFKHDKTFLLPEGKRLLKDIEKKIEAQLKVCDTKLICVEGHASLQSRLPPGKREEHNQWLSDHRAQTARSYLEEVGLNKTSLPVKLVPYGCGDRFAHDGRKATYHDLQQLFDLDRRVEFKFKSDVQASCQCGEE